MPPSPHNDMDWLDEEDSARAALAETPEEVLRQIALTGNSDQARVAAIRLLLERGGTPNAAAGALMDWVQSLDGSALAKELAGFFSMGYVEPPEDQIQREVDRRVRGELKRRAKGLLDRVRGRDDETAQIAGPEPLPALPPPSPVTATEEVTHTVRVARTIRLDAGEEIDTSRPLSRVEQDKLNRQEIRDEMRERKRRQLPPGVRQHVPPGMDGDGWDRAWRG